MQCATDSQIAPLRVVTVAGKAVRATHTHTESEISVCECVSGYPLWNPTAVRTPVSQMPRASQRVRQERTTHNKSVHCRVGRGKIGSTHTISRRCVLSVASAHASWHPVWPVAVY